MKYCSECGSTVTLKIPDGDNRERFACDSCQTIFYSNPKTVVGAIPEWHGRILLCKRAIEPAYGKWTLPAGYLENAETLAEGASRETKEEACATIVDLQPYRAISIPHINQIYFMFRANLAEHKFTPGSESLDVKLVLPEEIPWEDLAFRVIRKVLRDYCRDLPTHSFEFQTTDLIVGK